MKKLLFLINPKAGRTTIKNELFTVIETFSNAGYLVEVYTTKGPGDASSYVMINGWKYDVVVCAGGDGTLDNTVDGIIKLRESTGKNVPIGYIPCGTTNDFARSLRISRNPVEAANDIVVGEPCSIDVGKIKDKIFAYIAAFGVFTDVSYSTPQDMKNILGHTAYVLEAFKNISNYKSYNIDAKFDDRVASGEYIYGQITNTLSVGGFRAMGTKSMSFCDGKFECILIRKPNNPNELRKILNSFLTDEIDEELIFHEKASKVYIESDNPITWTVDGEFGGEYAGIGNGAWIENQQNAVNIILRDKTTYIGVTEENK